MLTMNQIDEIKELQRQGYGPLEISRRFGIDRKTASRYMGNDSFSEENEKPCQVASKLDPWKAEIDGWLIEDRRMRFKQRHTAQRVYDRLKELHADFDGSYTLVQRYLKAYKTKQRQYEGALELVWHAGEAQADFGEADVLHKGALQIIKYLTLSFPQSNAAYMQAFGGETAECVCQGLRDIFHRIGGVPLRIVFDNATGIGRRVRDQVTFSELFLRFKCHYGFSVSFCNPASGNEKGNVENKVGYLRRTMLVPAPEIDDLAIWNESLLPRCEADFERPHYKKNFSIAELFRNDVAALAPLPEKPFRVERLVKMRTDGYGKFCMDGAHWYSSAPEHAYQNIVVGIGAHALTVYAESGDIVACHARQYGSMRTDTCDYVTSIDMLVKKPGAWKNCALRERFDPESRSIFDGFEAKVRSGLLEQLGKASARYGFDSALAALLEAVKQGRHDTYSLQALSARKAYDVFGDTSDSGPNLRRYDAELLSKTGGAS